MRWNKGDVSQKKQEIEGSHETKAREADQDSFKKANAICFPW